MALRTPWFQERSTLFALSVLDAFWMGAFYNLTSILRLQRLPGLDPIGLLLICSWTGLSYLSGRYSNRRRRSNDRVLELVRTALVAVLVLGLAVVVFSWGLKTRDPRTFRGFLIPLFLGVSLASSLSEQRVRAQLGRRRDPWILVSSPADLAVIEQEEQPLMQQTPIRLVPTPEVHAFSQELQRSGPGRWAGLAVGDLHGMSADVIDDLANSRATGLRVSSLISWCETYLQRVPPELVSPEWWLQAEGFELHPGSLTWRIKRIGDLGVGALLVLLTAPLVLISALLIWLEDRGPVFYTQERSGIYDTTIRIIKLRTMQVDAETDQAQWAQRNDPRITRTGQWLRKLRIDELPQLFNVLKGDMSLIGPRPERPEIDAELERQIPNYRLRYLARPGLSGWAQVCFPYGASIADSRMKLSYDIYYLRNANLLLDLFILIKTIRLVLRGSGSEPHNQTS
ncbi:MAG: exopolysaccharide biosynthesis polyprenyl glycosylphosphotransferase [Cyanobacteria bacterium M_surface_9_m1_291]|nr:exopolysaccharide biosynthesis polyprenyl glycosylphosphotransferase [Cyanobacteria bacterium M_surface_9_m1_291]